MHLHSINYSYYYIRQKSSNNHYSRQTKKSPPLYYIMAILVTESTQIPTQAMLFSKLIQKRKNYFSKNNTDLENSTWNQENEEVSPGKTLNWLIFC